MDSENRLSLVRKLAHDVNGPLGNVTAFIELAQQQIEEALSADHIDKEAIQLGLGMMSMAMPSIIQLQRNIRMWSASHQIVSQEYGVQLLPIEINTQIQNSFKELKVFLDKKEIQCNIEGEISDYILADAELMGLIIFHLFDLAVSVGDQNQVMNFKFINEAEKGFNVNLALNGPYPEFNEILNTKIGSLTELPASFDFGVIKPLAYGNLFLPLAMNAMGGFMKAELKDAQLSLSFTFPED
jgi:signal transduction histidine kinase